MCYLDYGGILSRLESESTNGRLVFGLPPIGCCSPCQLSSHNGVPLCLLFYSLLSLNPDSAAFSQIPGVRNNMGFYIHFHSAPAPLNQLCVRVSPTFHYIWLKLVYMRFVFMWHMPFGQQIQWFSRISFQKSSTNVNFTKKTLHWKAYYISWKCRGKKLWKLKKLEFLSSSQFWPQFNDQTEL